MTSIEFAAAMVVGVSVVVALRLATAYHFHRLGLRLPAETDAEYVRRSPRFRQLTVDDEGREYHLDEAEYAPPRVLVLDGDDLVGLNRDPPLDVYDPAEEAGV